MAPKRIDPEPAKGATAADKLKFAEAQHTRFKQEFEAALKRFKASESILNEARAAAGLPVRLSLIGG